MSFNHAYSLGFEVISENEEAEDVTSEMLRAALMRRIEELDNNETWLQSCEAFDTFDMDEDEINENQSADEDEGE